MAAIKPPVLSDAKRASFHQGWHWLITAANQVAAAPWRYFPALLWLVFIGSLQWLIPGAGSFLSGLLAPLSIAPLLLSFAHHDQATLAAGKPITYRQQFQYIFSADQLMPLLRLGFYLMLVVLVLSQISGWLMSRLLDPDVLAALEKQDLSHLAQVPKHELMLILSFTVLPMATLGLLAWLSIPLVMFCRAPIPQVLSLSLRASVRNWRAFLAMNILLTIVCLGALLILLVVTLVAQAVSAALGALLSTALLVAFSCFIQAALVGAQYLACQDIFAHKQDDQESSLNPSDSQIPGQDDKSSGYWEA